MTMQFKNQATSLLASSITATDTTIELSSGDESKFPALTAGTWHPVTVYDGSGNIEIMRATSRSGTTVTVARGQEGTTAKIFAAGARIDLRITASIFDELNRRVAGVFVAAVAGAGFKTLTEIESENYFHNLVGLRTGILSYILPTAPKLYQIHNGTTGGFEVTVRTASGTGVIVPADHRQIVLTDGTDVVPVTPPMKATGAIKLPSATLDALSLAEQASAPANEANIGKLYAKDISSVTELFFRDSAGNETQVTVNGAINGSALAPASIIAAMLATNAVTTPKILDANVTLAKLDNLSANKLIGRATPSTGVPEAVGLGSMLQMNSGNLEVKAASTASAGIAALATAAQARAQSATNVVLTPSNSADCKFESAEIAIVAASTANIPHPFGVRPSDLDIYLRCKVAEAGYLVGEEVKMNWNYSLSGYEYGVMASIVNHIYLSYTVGDRIPVVYGRSAPIGDVTSITAANWRIVLKARL